MSQRSRVTGTRSSALWLLILIAVALIIGIVVAAFIFYPGYQREQAAAQHYAAGVAFQAVSDWEAAADEYRQVIAVAADYLDVQARFAEVRASVKGAIATAMTVVIVQAKQTQLAGDATATAVPVVTEQALEAHYQKGQALMNLKRWDEAKAEMEAVFRVDPNYSEVQAKMREIDMEIAKAIPTATPTSPVSPTPEATPTPLASPTPAVLFWDDFQDKSASATKWTPMGGLWEITDGKYFCSVGGTYKSAVSVAGDVSWQDFIYTLDVMGTEGVDKAVFFRYRDDKNTYAITIRSDPYNDISLGKGRNGNDILLQQAALGNRNGVWYSINITVIANVIKVYVNNDLYISYLDDSLPILNGRIGVGVWTGATGNTTNHFDNVRVLPARR